MNMCYYWLPLGKEKKSFKILVILGQVILVILVIQGQVKHCTLITILYPCP